MTLGRWILAAIVVAVVGFATVQGLKPHPPPSVEVSTTPSKRSTVTRLVTAAGHMQAVQTVKVSSNVTGDLISLSVAEGNHVKMGQVLGQIDKRAYQAQVAQFRAAVASNKAQIDQINASIEQDKRDVARAQDLVNQKLDSAADLEKVQTTLKIDEGRLAAQKQQVESNHADGAPRRHDPRAGSQGR
jgi:HlyD family secretion protein